MKTKIEKTNTDKELYKFLEFLSHTIVYIEKIQINPPKEEIDFLFPENISNVKLLIDTYSHLHLCIQNKHKALFERGKETQRKTSSWTVEEIKIMTQVAFVTKTRQQRALLIDLLNHQNKNPFIQLSLNNKSQIKEIESQWILFRSHFAQIHSTQLLHAARALKNIKNYFDMIKQNSVLPIVLKKYSILLALVEEAWLLIENEEKNLCLALLARLSLAKLRLPDDVLLATFQSLLPLGLSELFFKKNEPYFNKEILSSYLATEFYNYIMETSNKFLIKELQDIYQIHPAKKTKNMSSFAMKHMAGYKYENTPWPIEPSDFSATNLTGSVFVCSNFRNSLLISANFKAADLRDAFFENANMHSTNFTFADGRGAQLHWVYAMSASFVSADFSQADFHGSFLSKTNFEKCTLYKTNFQLANLYKANMRGISGSCNFNYANLSNACLYDIDISKNTYIGANLLGTQFINNENENEILFMLDKLESELKDRPNEKGLLTAIARNITDKFNREHTNKEAEITISRLLQHSLFKPHSPPPLIGFWEQWNNQTPP